MNKEECILFSGGAPGAEACFGESAEQFGIEEVHFSFEGGSAVRQRGIRMLNHEELKAGDVSLDYVSRLMNRRYTDSPTMRKVLQSIWYQINNGQEIYVIGTVLADKTVKGGTGWGAEFAKLCNKPLYVFDQEQNAWSHWNQQTWVRTSPEDVVVRHPHFTGTGTRVLAENGRQAIADLFRRSFA